MGKTLFEMLCDRFKGPIEHQVANPLKMKLGQSMTIKDIDYKGLVFYLKRILEYKRTINGEDFVFTDYELQARPFGADEVNLRLRLNPIADPDAVSGLTHNAVLLKMYDELAYTEDFHKIVNDTTKQFQVFENGVMTEQYWRVNDVQESYKTTVTVVDSASVDKGVKKVDELPKNYLEFWDYHRETVDEANQKLIQYLFVEMDQSNGWFQIWRGAEIDTQLVSVL
jgi:hypothetical protein